MKSILLLFSEEFQTRLPDFCEKLKGIIDSKIEGDQISYFTDVVENDSYDYIFTDNIEYERNEDEKVLVFSATRPTTNISWLPPSLLDNPIAIVSLHRFLGINATINIEQDLGADSEFRSIKVTDPLSIGHYQDIVTRESYLAQADFFEIGKAFNEVAIKFFKDLQALPVEVDLIKSSGVFALQFHASINNYKNVQEDLITFLKDQNSHLTDLFFLNKTEELVINLTWLKDQNEKGFLFHSLEAFSTPSNNVYNILDKLVDSKTPEVVYKAKEKKEGSENNLSKIKKVIDYLKKQKELLGKDYSMEACLDTYPARDSLVTLTEEDFEFIRKVVGDKAVYETINNSIVGQKNRLASHQDVKRMISQAIDEMDVFEVKGVLDEDDDIIARISGVTENLTEDITRVSGKIDEDNSVTRVEGTTEHIKEEATIVSGSSDQEVDELWKVKKLDLVEKVSQAIQGYVNSGATDLEELEDRIREIIKEELGLTDEQAKSLGDAVVLSAAANSLGEELNESADENIFFKLENDKLKGLIEKKEDQIMRLKRVMDSMKADFVARKEADDELRKLSQGENQSAETKLRVVENKLATIFRELKNKEAEINLVKKQNEHTVKNKNHRIGLLEERLSDLTSRNSELHEASENREKERELEIKAKNLEIQLRLANEKMDEFKTQAAKADELEKQIRDINSGSSQAIEVEKEKVIILEKQLKEMNERLNKIPEAPPERKESEVVRELEGKVRDMENAVKQAELEKKKYEQKLKYTNSHIQELEKKLKRAMKATLGNSGGSGVGDKRAKQLEKNLEKVNEMKDKVESELSKKREEAHKYKQENAILTNRITDLEKKLSVLSKKAA